MASASKPRLLVIFMVVGGSAFAAALHQQQHATNKCGRSDDRGKWQGVLLFRRHLDGAEVDGLLGGGVGEALVGKSGDAEHNEQDADDGGWFHKMD